MQKSKFILAVIFNLLFIVVASAQKQTPLQKKLEKKKEAFKLWYFNTNHTWEQNGFKGKVKTVETFVYYSNDSTGALDKAFDKHYTDSFSTNGYSLDGIWTSPNGGPSGRWLCYYDAQHHDTMNVSMKDDGTIDYADKKNYDAKGRQINRYGFNTYSKVYAVSDEYKYDGKDNLIFWLHRQSQVPIDYSEDSLTYYDFGLVKTITSIDHRSNTRSIKTYTYDANYDIICESYDMGGEYYYANTYKYDKNDNRLAQYTCRRTGDTESWNKYKYNSLGDLIQDDSYTYKEGEHKPIHEIYTTEYEYDYKNNLTKKTTYRTKNGKRVPQEMTINRYTYY